MVEVNCETDFVARGPEFRSFAQAVAQRALAARPGSLDVLARAKLADGATVDERRRALIAKIDENIGVRRFAVLASPESAGRVRARHAHRRAGGRQGRPRRSLAYDLAMHIAREQSALPVAGAGATPRWWRRSAIFLPSRRAARVSRPRSSPRWSRAGTRKALGEMTLAGRPFVKDPDVSIEKLLKGAKAEVLAFESASRSAPGSKKKPMTSSPR